MTVPVVLFTAGTVEAALDAVAALLEDHMRDFTPLAKQQFVKRVSKLLKELKVDADVGLR